MTTEDAQEKIHGCNLLTPFELKYKGKLYDNKLKEIL